MAYGHSPPDGSLGGVMEPQPIGVHLLVRVLGSLLLGLAVLLAATACSSGAPPFAPGVPAPGPPAPGQPARGQPGAPGTPGAGDGAAGGAAGGAAPPSGTPQTSSPPEAVETSPATPTTVIPSTSQTAAVAQGASPDTQLAQTAALANARRAALRDGKIVYHAPSPMRQGQVQRIAVNASGIAEQPQAEASLPPAPGAMTEHSIAVGLTLVADLKGDGFEVTPLTPVIHEVPE